MFCLFVPEELVKKIQSIELCVNGKLKYSKKLKREGTMWNETLTILQTDDKIEYNYKLVLKKKFYTYFKKPDVIPDLQKRNVCFGHIQRDILLINSFHGEEKATGIVAHIDDILLKPNFKLTAAFDELDRLESRNILTSSHWNSAFGQLLDGEETENICLLLLHCICNKSVSDDFSSRKNVVSKIWAQLHHLNKASKGICIQFVGEIFQIYEALSTSQRSPVHIINDMQSILDISSLHKLLKSNSSYLCHNCSKSQQCMQSALQFILSQDEDCNMLYDIVCLIFSYIPEKEVLEAFAILGKCNAANKNQELKNMVQNHILGKIEKILTDRVGCFNFKEVSDILSKAQSCQRLRLVQLCETEILNRLQNLESFRYGFEWKNLELLCIEQKMFQTTHKKILLLETVLKLPLLDISRNFIKYVIMDFQISDCTSTKETLEKAFDVLINTLPVAPVEAFKMCFEEYDILSDKLFFQKIREHIEKRLKLYISKYPISDILQIHADVENLHSATIDFYCQQLKERLKNQSFHEKLDFFETNWNHLDTRYYIKNSCK